MDPFVDEQSLRIAAHFERELEALVAISSPSGDIAAAEESIAVVSALLPETASIERVPCSSPDHADDLIARLPGTGSGRIVLVGHLDTVVSHPEHRPVAREGDKITGSGTVDMKGGDVMAIGVMRALATRPDLFAEVALLLVVDEEWRLGHFAHVDEFARYDACLCFEAGQTDHDGREAVVVKRKGAGTIEIVATGRSSHSGSAPDRGINALLALAAAAQAIAACHDPSGPDHLTAVPTVISSGEAFNVVPSSGRLIADVRADDLAAFDRVLEAVPQDVGGATLVARQLREWPGMDSREPVAPVLARAAELAGMDIVGARRGGASDAAHFAASIPVTIDGLGPRGGGAHASHEHIAASSILPRARIALAVAVSALQAS